MSDMLDRISEDQDPFRKLASKLPGFSGYIERENRRAADKILRESLADRFEAIRKQLSDVQKDLAAGQELSYLDDLEGAATKLQTFVDKIRTAAYGNSSFFEAIKINADELANVYEYDLALLTHAEDIERGVQNLAASVGTDGMAAAVRHVVTQSRDVVAAFEQRSEVITGHSAE
ncbi:MAG: hypothetical protein KIT07_10980 [Anaerolineales bacterium]|nr:hypothetical protein [Anaerolineales bacterium]